MKKIDAESTPLRSRVALGVWNAWRHRKVGGFTFGAVRSAATSDAAIVLRVGDGIVMNWCCTPFQGWFEQAGRRGLGVFVAMETLAQPSFILQFRAVDPGRSVPAKDFPVSLISDVHIHFCPWCGANLEKVYHKTFRELGKSALRVPLK